MRFTKLEPGIDIELISNDGPADVRPNAKTLTKSVVPIGEAIQLNTPYVVDAKKFNLTILAVPKPDFRDTAFEFAYRVVGEEYAAWEEFFEDLKSDEDPVLWLWVWGLSWSLVYILLGALLGCCCLYYYRKR